MGNINVIIGNNKISLNTNEEQTNESSKEKRRLYSFLKRIFHWFRKRK